MFDQWQQPLDIAQLIRKGVTLEGEAHISQMQAGGRSSRLHDVVLNDPLVRFEFCFKRNEAGHRLIEGKVEASVDLVCQRCLEPVSQQIQAEVALGVVKAEQQAGELPDAVEPLLLDESPIWLVDLIEDEILLALPVVARHAHACVAEHREYDAADAVANPFAALRDLVKPDVH